MNYNFNFYKEIYNLLDPETDTRQLLEQMLSNYDKEERKKLIKQCLWSVNSFEKAKLSTLKTDNLLNAFFEELERYDPDVPDYIANNETFKLKCILTMSGFICQNLETIPEATFRYCTDSNYQIMEEAIINGKNIEYVTEGKVLLSLLVMAVILVTTELLWIPALAGMIVTLPNIKKISEAKGIHKSYKKAKKIIDRRDKKTFTASPDTDYTHEYFDPTYVNM